MSVDHGQTEPNGGRAAVIGPDSLQDLRRAAVRATLAPSVHNTQPWRMVIENGELALLADRSRQLHAVDPVGRQLVISCGCALLNARASLAAAGYDDVLRMPAADRPELLALVGMRHCDIASSPLAVLDSFIEGRQTNRRHFDKGGVSEEIIEQLAQAAAAEGALLVPITRDEHRYALARLTEQADREQNADPAYRAELRAWTSVAPGRLDGVPSDAVPNIDGDSGVEVPRGDIDAASVGHLPSAQRSRMNECMLVLGTNDDSPSAWLRAGEALERVLLEATRYDLATGLFTQVVEVPQTRAALREELALGVFPQVVLRVGYAPKTPATRRRRLVDVISESE